MISPGPLHLPPDLASSVDERDYARLLGYPKKRIPEGAISKLAATSRRWYQEHGGPAAFACALEIVEIAAARIDLAGGLVLSSPVLAGRLRAGEATALIAAVVTAGPEVDDRARDLWNEERPDESYLLERFGVAVAERLAVWTADELRHRVVENGRDLLPGYSPGYDGWPLEDQPALFSALAGNEGRGPIGELRVLDSGMLTPKSSLLAVFGVTSRPELAERLWNRHKCSWCSLESCGFRHSGSVPRGGRA